MKKGKHTGHDAPFLDDEERAVIEAAERGELAPDPDPSVRFAEWQVAASETSRKRAITIRLREHDIHRIKAIALRKGMPYQTHVSSIIHQYASGTLKESD
jgi:predicted  nucleic acid-binding Zn-ribbon protein